MMLSKAIQLLKVDSNLKFVINQEATKLFSEETNEFSVISVVGPSRTGKSFLLNKISGVHDAFITDSKTYSCTKGLLVYSIFK